MDKKLLLVVDPDPRTAEALDAALTPFGLDVASTGTGQAVLASCRTRRPDILVLEPRLPDMPGLALCLALKSAPLLDHVPLVVVSEAADEGSRVAAFEAGADDFLAKPFSVRELGARIRNLLRRFEHAAEATRRTWTHGGLRIDFEAFSVQVHGEDPRLTAAEFRLLAELARREGQILDRQELAEAAGSHGHAPSPRAVDTMIRRLRGKLGPCGVCLETVRKAGYRLGRP